MKFTSITIIVMCCYVIGEIYKVIKKQETYKYIPLLLTIIGGVLGVLIYITDRTMIFNVSNIWIALGMGMVSGASATGSNQIIKQIFKKEGKKENE